MLNSKKNKPGKVKVFDCPKCGAGITLRAVGQSLSAVCGSCGSVVDVTNENLQIISKVNQKVRTTSHFQIGQRGKFKGVLWEVIGFMERGDLGDNFSWREYLLFNPYQGFRWLTEYDGHWNWVTMVKERPESLGSGGLIFQGKRFDLFSQGQSKVKYVLGEFYWRVRVNDQAGVADYICPPDVLSRESYSSEVTWSYGEYVSINQIESAFGSSKYLPYVVGVGANQPNPHASSGSRRLWGLFVALLMGIQFYTVSANAPQEVLRENLMYSELDFGQTRVTPSFELGGKSSFAVIGLQAPLKNSWLNLDGKLIQEGTEQSFDFGIGIHFYSGYGDEGTWTEGRTDEQSWIRSVPSGTYHISYQLTGPKTLPSPSPEVTADAIPLPASTIALTPASSPTPSPQPSATPNPNITPIPYRVTVQRGGSIWSNFFLALFVLSIFPLYTEFMKRRFELKRWSDSDYSPHWSADE